MSRALPSGEPKRLTPAAPGGKDTYEFFPAFSRDGQWIVYTTWNDTDFGRVRVIRPDGSGGRDVVAQPGHYVRAVVLARRQVDRLPQRRRRFDSRAATTRDDRHLRGADGRRRAAARARERFGAAVRPHRHAHLRSRSAQREVHAAERRRADRGSPLPGRDEIEHFRSDNATQIVPSPDGKWVAFDERFHTYVAPFPRTGRPVDIGPATQTYPVQRVSRDAGFYLHWSGDSRRLHWALGPSSSPASWRARSRSSPAVQAKAAEPEAKGIPIGFTAKSDMPPGIVALVGARIITMANLAAGPIQGTPGVIENATVIVEGNRITAIGPSSR